MVRDRVHRPRSLTASAPAPQLLGAHTETVDDGGERVALLEALLTESRREVAAEGGDVCRPACQQPVEELISDAGLRPVRLVSD